MLATRAACTGSPARAPSRSTTWSDAAPSSAKRLRLVHRVVAEHGRLGEVALPQPDGLAALQVDGRVERDHAAAGRAARHAGEPAAQQAEACGARLLGVELDALHAGAAGGGAERARRGPRGRAPGRGRRARSRRCGRSSRSESPPSPGPGPRPALGAPGDAAPADVRQLAVGAQAPDGPGQHAEAGDAGPSSLSSNSELHARGRCRGRGRRGPTAPSDGLVEALVADAPHRLAEVPHAGQDDGVGRADRPRAPGSRAPTRRGARAPSPRCAGCSSRSRARRRRGSQATPWSTARPPPAGWAPRRRRAPARRP